jgi:RPA family protein
MKKIYFSMMALAIAAFTFTSCEDVPEPYNNPYDQIKPSEPEVVIEPAGSGTAEDPYNVAAIIEQTASLADGEFFNNSENVYVTGVVVETKEVSAQYGNATYYIADNAKSADRFYVYRGKLLDGASVAAETDLEVGDSVTVCGKIKNYKGTLEFDQGNYLTYIKKSDGSEQSGGGSGSSSGEGKGTADSPYDVTAAIAAASGTGVYVKGFIVGSIDGKATTDAKFSAETATASNVLIAVSADETDITKCMPVQLPTGAVRTALNLVDNAGNYKKEVTLYGNIEKYFSVTGLKTVTYAILDGTEIGTKPDGGSTGGDEIKAVTVAEFNAAPEITDVWYKLTGTIKNLKDGDLYGNFDLEDATGSVYVYGLLAEKGGEKKKFQELVTKYGLANGSKITIIGNRGSYNDKIEVVNAYISTDGGGSGTGGDSSTGTLESPLTASQAYDIVAAMEAGKTSDADYYVKGKICSIKFTFSAQYGTATFNISDDGATGGKEFIAYSCYYFGNQPWVEGNTQVQVGDEVIVCGKVINYQGNTPEFASKKNYLVKLNSQTSASRQYSK